MIKKTELLRRLEIAEHEIDDLRRARNIDVDNTNLSNERTTYVLSFLADKLGYEIRLKDVVKVNCGIKSIATEVEMVEKPKMKLMVSASSLPNFTGDCCGSEQPKQKRKYTKRKKK